MIRALEVLSFGALAVALHLVAASLLPEKAEGNGLPPGNPGLAMGSAGLSQMADGWGAAPPAPQPSGLNTPEPDPSEAPLPQPAQPTPPEIETPEIEAPEIEAAPQVELPPLRPAMGRQMALPSAAPEIASALLLEQSERPQSRPVRRSAPEPQRQERAQPRREQAQQQPARQQAASSQQQSAAPAGNGGGQPARGGGGGGGGGTGGPSQDQLRAKWAGQVQACIKRGARNPARLTQAGRVTLNIAIGGNGRVRGVSVGGSSGVAQLDQAAVRAVQSVRRCPAAPRGLAGDGMTFQMPFNLQPG